MFDRLFTFIFDLVVTTVGAKIGAFTSVISPLLGTCVALYALYIVWKALFNDGDFLFIEALKFLVSLVLVTTMAFSSEYYMGAVVPFVLGGGDSIATAVIGGGGASSALQSIFDTMFITVGRIWENFTFEIRSSNSWLELLLNSVNSALIILGNSAFLMVSAAYLIVAKFMLGLLLLVGPLFIMMAFFPPSRDFFKAWTGQCFNNMLLTIMYSMAFSFFQKTIDHTVGVMSPGFLASVMTAIIFVILIILALRIPTLCSTISGGFGISGINSEIMAGYKFLKRDKRQSPDDSSNKTPKGKNSISAG